MKHNRELSFIWRDVCCLSFARKQPIRQIFNDSYNTKFFGLNDAEIKLLDKRALLLTRPKKRWSAQLFMEWNLKAKQKSELQINLLPCLLFFFFFLTKCKCKKKRNSFYDKVRSSSMIIVVNISRPRNASMCWIYYRRADKLCKLWTKCFENLLNYAFLSALMWLWMKHSGWHENLIINLQTTNCITFSCCANLCFGLCVISRMHLKHAHRQQGNCNSTKLHRFLGKTKAKAYSSFIQLLAWN